MKGTNQQLDLSKCHSLIMGRVGIGNKFVQQLMVSAILHVLWIIWIEINNRYFQNSQACMGTLINGVISEFHLNFDLAMAKSSSSVTNFKISLLFHTPLRLEWLAVLSDIHWIHLVTH